MVIADDQDFFFLTAIGHFVSSFSKAFRVHFTFIHPSITNLSFGEKKKYLFNIINEVGGLCPPTSFSASELVITRISQQVSYALAEK
jgi:hypothetical protein